MEEMPIQNVSARAGGTVEPASREQAPQRKPPAGAERYELRDPFSEITYRARSEPEIVRKAEELGSLRYVAVDFAGRRTVVEKIDDAWHRGRPGTAAPTHADDTTAKPAAARETPGPTQATPQPDERMARQAELEAALVERYVIKRAPITVGDTPIGPTEYRFRGDVTRIAFTESTFRLATDTNSPSVARSMVDVAETRQWSALRVSGHDDFRRMVWMEASARGVKALGYEPSPSDLDLLRRAREERLVNRIEPAPGSDGATARPSGRGDGGRKAVLAAIEAVLVARGVPETKRQAVMAAAAEKLTQRMGQGQKFQVRVYDKSAPSKRPTPTPVRPPQQAPERATPTR